MTQSDLYTSYTYNFDRNFESLLITPPSVVSTLHIENAQYPDNEGEYVCTGSHNHSGVTSNSSATTTLQFIGESYLVYYFNSIDVLGLWPLLITYYPEVLFSSDSLLESSVVWLYCETNSTSSTLTMMWTKDGNPLVQDVPHIIIRKIDASTSLLIVNDLQISDGGQYQCSAEDDFYTDKGIGSILNITGT